MQGPNEDPDRELVERLQQAGEGDLRAFVIRNILAGFYTKRILRVGDPIEIDGQRGVLTGITATHAVIESERETITISNVHILDSVAKQGAAP